MFQKPSWPTKSASEPRACGIWVGQKPFHPKMNLGE
jgi:hypothetical protein